MNLTHYPIFVIRKLRRQFAVPVIFAIGNNDSACGDYRMDLKDPLLTAIAYELTGLSRDPSAKSDFQKGGYYSIPHPTVATQDVIVLNSVFWSQKYKACDNNAVDDPGKRQLRWLDQKLAAAESKGRSVILVMHIPPGIDAYDSFEKGHAILLWKAEYMRQFSEIVKNHPGVVKFALAGHIHRDDFCVLLAPDGSALLPIRITSSVSPVYWNNPEFSVMSYVPGNGAVSDFTTYSLDLASSRPVWNKYSFFAEYGIKAFDTSNMQKLVDRIQGADGDTQKSYQQNYGPQASGSFRYYSCALTTLSETKYNSCVSAPIQ